jgi:hypothetical protein
MLGLMHEMNENSQRTTDTISAALSHAVLATPAGPPVMHCYPKRTGIVTKMSDDKISLDRLAAVGIAGARNQMEAGRPPAQIDLVSAGHLAGRTKSFPAGRGRRRGRRRPPVACHGRSRAGLPYKHT